MDNIHKMNPTLLLDPEAPLFSRLRVAPPEWWTKLVRDPEIYIEIRKGNKIHAYYYGARIAEITFEDGKILAKCHPTYISGNKDDKNSKYVSCIDMLEKNLKKLKENAQNNYVKSAEDEDTSEKRVQGRLRIDNVNRYIDSEFEHSYTGYDADKNFIRFDLVAVEGNEIKVEELKRIGDNRLRTNDMVSNPPEVLEQIKRYSNFMSVNKDALCRYYQTVIKIKESLGLPTPNDYDSNKPLILDLKPLLIIKNLYRYSNMTKARFDRIKDICDILKANKVKYYILP